MNSIKARRAIEWVMELMAVPGKSGEEAAIADCVIDRLQRMGISDSAIGFDTAHRRTPLKGQVGNLIVKLPGTLRGRPRILFSAHLDTVPICEGARPKQVGKRIESSDKSTGLGADDRAGVAAILVALAEVLESGRPYPPLALCFFIQEEIGLQGSRLLSVSKLGKPAMAFNFDGGDPAKMTVGATGGERLKIRLVGLAAHAGLAPETGASAIHAAGLAIASLQKNGWLGRVHKKRRTGTSNIGVVEGGSATNVVCDLVEVRAEVRSHDGSFRTEIADAFQHAFIAAAAQIVNHQGVAVRAEVARSVDYESFRLDEDALPVRLAEQAITRAGGTAQRAVTNGGVDANWLVQHGIPTVTLGCGQRDVHTLRETLDIADFLTACRTARSLMVDAY